MLPTPSSAKYPTYIFNQPDETPSGLPLSASTSTHLSCDCSDTDHMILVRTWACVDPNNHGYMEFDIGMQAAPNSSIWKRARRALAYIFTGNTSDTWWHSTSLNNESVMTLHDQCEKYLAYVQLHDEQRQQSSAPVETPEPQIITAAEVEECIRKFS